MHTKTTVPNPDLLAGHHGSQAGARETAAPLPHPGHARREAHADVGGEPAATDRNHVNECGRGSEGVDPAWDVGEG